MRRSGLPAASASVRRLLPSEREPVAPARSSSRRPPSSRVCHCALSRASEKPLSPEVAEMVYYGFWYAAKMDALMAFIREAQKPVTDLMPHIARMEGFHRRYMVSNKILRLWVQMARQLPIDMIVPQHGAPIMGKPAITDLFNWLEGLQCGIDLFDQRAYQLPAAEIDPVARQVRVPQGATAS